MLRPEQQGDIGLRESLVDTADKVLADIDVDLAEPGSEAGGGKRVGQALDEGGVFGAVREEDPQGASGRWWSWMSVGAGSDAVVLPEGYITLFVPPHGCELRARGFHGVAGQ